METGFQPGGRAPAPAPLDLVQDYVNTEVPDWARDDLSTPAELEDWLRGRGLLAVGEHVDAAAFVRARALRRTLRELALLNTVGKPPDEAQRARVGTALAGMRFELTLDDAGKLVPVAAGDVAERALASLAAVVLEAQASGTWRRLKACRKEGCGWVFYDASRNLSSSWCSMSICGNRTKTAAYRRRRRGRS